MVEPAMHRRIILKWILTA